MSRGQAQITVHRLDGGPDRIEVRQRLAHSHEHDIAELAPALQPAAPRGDHHLLDDLSRTELPTKTCVSGSAESAAHRATGLAGDAHGRAVAVSHQDRLYALAVARLEQPLQRGAPVRDALGRAAKRRCQCRGKLEPVAERPWEICQLPWFGQALVEAVEHLAHAV